jgi:hypothetical protein
MGFTATRKIAQGHSIVTLADKILFAVLVCLTAASFGVKNIFASEGSIVIIELAGNAVYKGDLLENRKVTVTGKFGDVRIQIRDGKVGVVSAECPNKVCVRTGWRSLAGESIICVPNRVLVKILGERSNVVRGVTG